MKLTGKTLVLSAALALAMGVMSGTAKAETMILASPQAPECFDGDALKAHTQNVVTQVYENLVAYGTMEVDGITTLNPNDLRPHLAESWTV